MVNIYLLKGGARDLKKQNMHGAASLKKRKTEFPTDMHAQCKLSREKGKFCFFKGIFQKCPQKVNNHVSFSKW